MSILRDRRAPGIGLALILLAGVATLSLSTVDAGRWSKAPESTVPPPATLQALLEEGSQQRHTMYAVLRTGAPGARIVSDTLKPGTASTLYLVMLGGAGRVEAAPLPGDWIPDRVPDATGALRDSSWMLYREPGPIDTILLGQRDGRTVLVDRRSIPDVQQERLGLARWEPAVPIVAPTAPSLGRAVVVESGLLVLLTLMGGLVLPRRSAPGMTRPALALLAGSAVQAVTAYVFLLGRPAILVGPALAVTVGLMLRRRGAAPGWERRDLPALLVGTAAATAIVVAVRHLGIVIVTADSIQHTARSIAMGSGLLGLSDLAEKRPLAGAAVHAPGYALGVEGLHALNWVLLAAAAVVIVLMPRLLGSAGPGATAGPPIESTVRGPGWPGWIGVAVAGFAALLAGALLINPLVGAVTSTVVTTSTLLAVILLLLVVLWERSSVLPSVTGIAPVVVISLLALVPTRTESILVVGLVLLATLVDRDRAMRWPWAWPAVGLGLAAWNGLHVLASSIEGSRPSVPVTVLAMLGVMIALAGPVLQRVPRTLRAAVPWTVGLAIWGFVLVLGLTQLGAENRIFRGLSVNIGEGDGAWGVFAPVLATAVVLSLIAHLRTPDRRLVLPFWIMLGAFPSVIIAKAADGTDGVTLADPAAAVASILSAGARIGSWGDSANRMWTHFVVVAIAFLVMTVVVAVDGRSDDERTGGRRTVLGIGAASGLAAIGVVLATWSPAYLGPAVPATTEVIEQRDTDGAVTEMTGDVTLQQDLQVPAIDIPEDAEELSVCVTFRFTDLGRVNWGTTRFGIDGAGIRRSDSFGEMAWSGERERSVCLEDAPLREGPLTVTAWVSADRRAVPGSSAAVRTDADGGPVTSLDVRYLAASEDPRSLPMRVASRVLRLAMQAGPAVVTVLLGAGLLLLRRRA